MNNINNSQSNQTESATESQLGGGTDNKAVPTIAHVRKPIEWSIYLWAFLITAIIFGVSLWVNNYLDVKRYGDVKSVQDQISLDLLSSETQFTLLKETSCENISSNALSDELNSISRKLGYFETSGGIGNADEIKYLKKYYSLLEIKDYLLMNQLRSRCGLKPLSILYFYGKSETCPECEKMGDVLTYLRQQYPELRVYSFDTDLSLSALDTLTSMFNIKSESLPAIVYNNKKYVGFKSIDEMKGLVVELKKIDKQRAIDAEKAEAEKNKPTSTPPTRKSTSTKETSDKNSSKNTPSTNGTGTASTTNASSSQN